MVNNGALYKAVKTSSIRQVQTVLDKGVDFEYSDVITCLHLATEIKADSIFDLILSIVTNVTAKNKLFKNALHVAVSIQNINIIRELLEKGADVEAKDDNYETPLQWAVWNRDESITELLLDKGAKVNVQDELGKSPLLVAVYTNKIKLVEKLLNKGAKIDHKDIIGQTALFLATEVNDIAILEMLLQRGSKVNMNDDHGSTPLHSAVKYENIKAIKILLNSGAKLDSVNGYGQTPLDITFSNEYSDRRDIKQILIEHFIKMKAANLEINISINDDLLINYRKFNPFRILCLEEWNKIRIKKFCCISLHDVFMKYANPIFAENQSIENFIKSDSLENDFPIYGGLIRQTFNKAKQRNVLLNNIEFNVNFKSGNTIRFIWLPSEIKRNIMSYLTDEELENLKKAHKNCELKH